MIKYKINENYNRTFTKKNYPISIEIALQISIFRVDLVNYLIIIKGVKIISYYNIINYYIILYSNIYINSYYLHQTTFAS